MAPYAGYLPTIQQPLLAGLPPPVNGERHLLYPVLVHVGRIFYDLPFFFFRPAVIPEVNRVLPSERATDEAGTFRGSFAFRTMLVSRERICSRPACSGPVPGYCTGGRSERKFDIASLLRTGNVNCFTPWRFARLRLQICCWTQQLNPHNARLL